MATPAPKSPGIPWLDIAGYGLEAGGSIMNAIQQQQQFEAEMEQRKKEFAEQQRQNAMRNFQTEVGLGQSGMGILDKQIEGARGRTNSPSYRGALKMLATGRA